MNTEIRFSPSPADQRNQAALRHPERSIYRCFLTDLAGFTDICRAGPDYADRQDRKKTGLFRLSPRNATILLLRRTDVNCFSILDLGVAHINVWPYTLHPGQRHTTILSEAICVDHNQVDECPDAEAPEGEQLEDTAHNTACVEAMYAKKTNEKTQQCRCNPASISPHHRLMVERTAIIVCETTSDDHNQVNKCPDAEAPEGEQLEDTADNAPRIEAMYAECAYKLA